MAHVPLIANGLLKQEHQSLINEISELNTQLKTDGET